MNTSTELRSKLDELRGRSLKSAPAGPLFHYTDTTGVIGIVAGATQRATNALFLNDEGEIRHTAQLVAELYRRELNAHPAALNPAGDRVLKSSDHIDWKLRDFLHRLNHLNEVGWFEINAYVSCFCEIDDLLSQWRAYGDRGGGFSIAYDPVALVESAEACHPSANPILGQLIYDPVAQTTLVTEIYRIVRDSLLARLDEAGLSKAPPEGAEPYTIAHAQAFANELFFYAPFLKQLTFSEEREWRLVLIEPTCAPRFRAHPLGPVPFVEVPLLPNTLASLRIGPRRDHALARKSLKLLTASRPLEIYSSEVTLR